VLGSACPGARPRAACAPMVAGMLGQAHIKPPGGLLWDLLEPPSICHFGPGTHSAHTNQGHCPATAPPSGTHSHLALLRATIGTQQRQRHLGACPRTYWDPPTPAARGGSLMVPTRALGGALPLAPCWPHTAICPWHTPLVGSSRYSTMWDHPLGTNGASQHLLLWDHHS